VNTLTYTISTLMITFPLLAGAIAAILHVVSGPDHLAAVTPMAIETKRKTWHIGFYWGLGHLLGMLIIGLLFFMFKELIPVEAISGYSEQLVAIVLIGIGLWSLYKLFYKEKIHVGSSINALENTDASTHSNKVHHRSNLRSSFSVGVLHGLAGIAHFILLLPALGFSTQFESMQYIIGFAIGTVLAMTAYTIVLGGITQKSGNNKLLLNSIRVAGGAFALTIGMYWLHLTF